jgi:hypothetical protein
MARVVMAQRTPDEVAGEVAAETAAGPLTGLRVHLADNPATDCEYAHLLVPEDRSVLLSLGSHELSLDLELPGEAEVWLREDYVPTEEVVELDLGGLRYLLDLTYPGGVLFVLAHFDEELKLLGIELSLRTQQHAEDGPEYLLRSDGSFERLYRETNQRRPAGAAEDVLLKALASAFSTLAAERPHLIGALPTPRYRALRYQPRSLLPM